MVAQQHHTEKGGKKGVTFHVTADVSALRGKPCTAIVHVLDGDGQPLRALRKEFSNSKGGAAVRASFTPKEEDVKLTTELFMPYDAIAAEQEAQTMRIASDIWSDDEGRYVAAQPFRAELPFNPGAGQEDVQAAAGGFERERDHVRREWKRHHHRRHGRNGKEPGQQRPHQPPRHPLRRPNQVHPQPRPSQPRTQPLPTRPGMRPRPVNLPRFKGPMVRPPMRRR
jgi:hypothetical protein